jgi:hypothetical protein
MITVVNDKTVPCSLGWQYSQHSEALSLVSLELQF